MCAGERGRSEGIIDVEMVAVPLFPVALEPPIWDGADEACESQQVVASILQERYTMFEWSDGDVQGLNVADDSLIS